MKTNTTTRRISAGSVEGAGAGRVMNIASCEHGQLSVRYGGISLVNPADDRLQRDVVGAEVALRTAAGADCFELINRLVSCVGTAGDAGEDRVLRIVGVQLAQWGLGALFENIYATVTDNGPLAKPGAGQRFLQSQFEA